MLCVAETIAQAKTPSQANRRGRYRKYGCRFGDQASRIRRPFANGARGEFFEEVRVNVALENFSTMSGRRPIRSRPPSRRSPLHKVKLQGLINSITCRVVQQLIRSRASSIVSYDKIPSISTR